MRNWNGPQWSWRKVLIAVVALMVVVALGRTLVPGAPGQGAVDTTGRGGRNAQAPEPRKPQRIVEFNGRRVPVGEGPVAVLNPALAKPGGMVSVDASGFDRGARVQIILSLGKGKDTPMTSAKANRDGVVSTTFTYPMSASNAGGKQVVKVAQEGSTKVAVAELNAQAGVGMVKISKAYGPPGTSLTLDAQGFMAKEPIKVYWGRITGAPTATLRADEHGTLMKVPIRVGVGAVGASTIILVGAKSKTTAVAPFQLLRQYPVVTTKPFAARAAYPIAVAGKGFAPNERVLVYFGGSTQGTPVMTMRADNNGMIGGTSFKVPFGLKGRQSLVFVGEQSRASAKGGFLALPYSPMARTNTYGGLPGTMLNFYVKGFASKEAVHVFANNELVSAFRVDAAGAAAAVGSYMIPGDAQGKLTFKLVGARSGGVGSTTITVDKSGGPVKLPPQPKYHLPPDLRN